MNWLGFSSLLKRLGLRASFPQVVQLKPRKSLGVLQKLNTGCIVEAKALGRQGPLQALKALRLEDKCPVEKLVWLEHARLSAILGACKSSLASVRSGVRCFEAFVSAAVGGTPTVFYPPKIEWLQAWAACFRHKQTYTNYLGYVKTACLVHKAELTVFDHPAIGKAKMSVDKSTRFEARPKLWIRRRVVKAMLAWSSTRESFRSFANLFLLAYTGGARINDMRKKLERGSVCHFISDCPPHPPHPGIPIPIHGHSDSDEYLNI